jgi:hypothetical protein
MSTGAKTRLMSEMKALRKENWINFEDVGCEGVPPPHTTFQLTELPGRTSEATFSSGGSV